LQAYDNSKFKISNGKFTDSEFPAHQSSLSKNQSKYPGVRWLRARDVFEKLPEVFAGNIEPKDIKQGELGKYIYLFLTPFYFFFS
jgi:Calpain family cysteine protease